MEKAAEDRRVGQRMREVLAARGVLLSASEAEQFSLTLLELVDAGLLVPVDRVALDATTDSPAPKDSNSPTTDLR